MTLYVGSVPDLLQFRPQGSFSPEHTGKVLHFPRNCLCSTKYITHFFCCCCSQQMHHHFYPALHSGTKFGQNYCHTPFVLLWITITTLDSRRSCFPTTKWSGNCRAKSILKCGSSGHWPDSSPTSQSTCDITRAVLLN